jgi:hypothetical protein
VAALIRDRGWGGLTAEDSIDVIGPDYVPARVRVWLVAPVDRLAQVERQAGDVLAALFHPVEGGPDGKGWPFGRPPSDSDLLRALATVEGLDRVDGIELTVGGSGSLDRFPANGLVCVDTADITVVVVPPEDRA